MSTTCPSGSLNLAFKMNTPLSVSTCASIKCSTPSFLSARLHSFSTWTLSSALLMYIRENHIVARSKTSFLKQSLRASQTAQLQFTPLVCNSLISSIRMSTPYTLFFYPCSQSFTAGSDVQNVVEPAYVVQFYDLQRSFESCHPVHNAKAPSLQSLWRRSTSISSARIFRVRTPLSHHTSARRR